MASRMRTIEARALRTQRAAQMAGAPTAGFFGDILRGIGKVAPFIPGIGPIIGGVAGAFGGPDPRAGQRPLAKTDCPTGYRANPSTGRCEKVGVRGTIERFLPGGETGMLPGVPVGVNGFGEAVVGSFGVPALVPAQLSAVSLHCPPGAVLGKDNLCYQKGSIPMQFRKWRPARKPPISAADWKHLTVSARVKTKAKKIAGTAGFTCKRR